MHVLRHTIARLGKKTWDQGASAVEYGMLVAAIAAIIVAVVFGLGHLVGQAFHTTCSALNAQPAGLGDANSCPDPNAPPAP